MLRLLYQELNISLAMKKKMKKVLTLTINHLKMVKSFLKIANLIGQIIKSRSISKLEKSFIIKLLIKRLRMQKRKKLKNKTKKFLKKPIKRKKVQLMEKSQQKRKRRKKKSNNFKGSLF